MSARNTNTSFLIGLAISAAVHIAALFLLQHIKIDAHRTKLSLAALTPNANMPMPQPEIPKPEEKLPDPDQPKPVPQDENRDVRFGIDNSNNQTKTWLGFLEGDTPTGMKGEVEQAAMSLDPGAPGAPGSAPAAPSEATPETPPSPPPSPPAENTPPAEMKPPDQVQPEKPLVPAPAPSRTAVPLPAATSGAQGETSDSKDPLADRAGVPNAKTGERVENSKPKDAPDSPELPKDPVTDKPDTKPGVDREGEKRPEEKDVKSALDGKGEEQKEVEAKLAEAIPAEKPPEVQPPLAQAPTPPQPTTQPATPTPPQPASQSATPTAGGQAKLKGVRSDRESEAVTNKVIDVVNRDGRVAAGRGLNIRTRRAEFTNTTLLTAPPRDTLVRISFQKAGDVKRAEFVDGMSTGNPNVDDPLLNAIYRWRASGADLLALRDSDTLSVVVRVTFK